MTFLSTKTEAVIKSTATQNGQLVIVDEKAAAEWMGHSVTRQEAVPVSQIHDFLKVHQNAVGGRKDLDTLETLKAHIQPVSDSATNRLLHDMIKSANDTLPPIEDLPNEILEDVYGITIQQLPTLKALIAISKQKTISQHQKSVIENIQIKLIRQFVDEGGRLNDLPMVNSFEDG